MSKRVWAIGAIVVVTVVGVFGISACGPVEAPPPPLLQADPEAVVFIPTGGSTDLRAVVKIVNVGDVATPISVRGPAGPRPTFLSNCPGTLGPGERCEVSIKVSGPGPVSGMIEVATPDDVVLRIPISGSV